jgi:hypothetical protein
MNDLDSLVGARQLDRGKIQESSDFTQSIITQECLKNALCPGAGKDRIHAGNLVGIAFVSEQNYRKDLLLNNLNHGLGIENTTVPHQEVVVWVIEIRLC